MPYSRDERHLVGSRSRSRHSAYSVSSEEFEEVMSGGTSPIPLARPREEAAAPPPVLEVDIPFGYYADPSGHPSQARRPHIAGAVTPVRSKAARTRAVEVGPSPSPRGCYPRTVDITAPPAPSSTSHAERRRRARPCASPTSSSSSDRQDAYSSEEEEEDDDDDDGEEEVVAQRGNRPPRPVRGGRPVGMLDVLETEHEAWLGSREPSQTPQTPQTPHGQALETAPAMVVVEPRSSAPLPPQQPPQQLQLQQQQQQQQQQPPSGPQPVLFYTSPFLALDAVYTHDAPPPHSSASVTSTSSSAAHSSSNWAISGGGAVSSQCCVCLLSSVCSCVALPCLIAKERHTLLFNDIRGRYVCCAGLIPCCLADPRVRPELYVTIAPPESRVLKGKYGIYPGRSMPASGLEEVAVANVTDKVNGLPQFGCYHKAGKAERRQAMQAASSDTARRGAQSTNSNSGYGYAANDLDMASPRQGQGDRRPTTCCCGCFVIDAANNMCFCNCNSGGCVSCRHPTACCARCPMCCMACEACCCFPCAALANRMLIRQHYGLKPDACIDGPVIGCYSCLRTCLLCASPPAPGSGASRFIGCCGTSNPNTCCSECAYSMATLLAACCCFLPCLSCAMAQHRDQIERVGYPLLSVFSPPDISGMT